MSLIKVAKYYFKTKKSKLLVAGYPPSPPAGGYGGRSWFLVLVQNCLLSLFSILLEVGVIDNPPNPVQHNSYGSILPVLSIA